MDPSEPLSKAHRWQQPIDDLLWQQVDELLPVAARARFTQLAQPRPTARDWRRFFSILLLGVGALFAATSVIFFFAANWQGLDRLSKLTVLMLAFIATGLSSRGLGLDRPAGRAAQIVAMLLLGTFLAVFGQSYQTGADDWHIFAAWTAMLIPWTLLSRWFLPWLLSSTLLNLSVLLMVDQVYSPDAVVPAVISAIVSGLAWAAWEPASRSRAPWLGKRIGPWILAGWTFLALMPNAVDLIFWSSGEPLKWSALVGLLALVAFGLTVYREFISSHIFVPTLALGSAITLFTLYLAEAIGSDDASSFFFIGLVLVLQISGAVWWLRGLHERAQDNRQGAGS